jgi:hypothetical protein
MFGFRVASSYGRAIRESMKSRLCQGRVDSLSDGRPPRSLSSDHVASSFSSHLASSDYKRGSQEKTLLRRPVRTLRTKCLLDTALNWDRWLEMAKQKTFTVATNVEVYICDPHSPWQRGTNENTNQLLQQYLPKKAHLSGYAQSELDKVALRLNQRPRKALGSETPTNRLRASVASAR